MVPKIKTSLCIVASIKQMSRVVSWNVHSPQLVVKQVTSSRFVGLWLPMIYHKVLSLSEGPHNVKKLLNAVGTCRCCPVCCNYQPSMKVLRRSVPQTVVAILNSTCYRLSASVCEETLHVKRIAADVELVTSWLWVQCPKYHSIKPNTVK